jgi:hypothetical protein
MTTTSDDNEWKEMRLRLVRHWEQQNVGEVAASPVLAQILVAIIDSLVISLSLLMKLLE